MNRVNQRKILYLLLMVTALFLAIWLAFKTQAGSLMLPILIAFILLIPGRINGYFWKDFYHGRKLMTLQKYPESLFHFEHFLETLREKPLLKQLIWFSYGVYSWDIEAMTWNNIGAIRLEQGDTEAAKIALKKALELDDKYPVPYFNKAICAAIHGDKDVASALFLKSEALGFTGGSVDQMFMKASLILAKIEG